MLSEQDFCEERFGEFLFVKRHALFWHVAAASRSTRSSHNGMSASFETPAQDEAQACRDQDRRCHKWVSHRGSGFFDTAFIEGFSSAGILETLRFKT